MTCFRKVVSILFLAALLCPISPARAADSNNATTQVQSEAQAQAQAYQRTIAEYRRQINGWQTSANIQVALVIIAGVCGVFVSSLHRVDKPWAKNIVLALGIATSVATFLSGSNAVFSADYRSLREAVSQADRLIARMDGIAPTIAFLSQPSDLATAKGQMGDLFNEYDAIADKVGSSSSTSTSAAQNELHWPFQIPVVHAQSTSSAAPAWIHSLPSDGRNLYFVGIGSDASLAKAKDNSLTDAKAQLDQACEFGPPYVSTDARRTLIGNSATVQDTYFTSSGNSQFTFYTLLRISRDIQRMLPAPAEYDQNGWHPLDLAFDPSAGLFVLDRDGKILKITQDQSGIHLQQLFQLPGALRPDAIAASQDSVYVSSNGPTGCNIFQYSFANRRPSQRNVSGGTQGCYGIATYGAGLFVAFPSNQEVRYWPAWSSQTTRSFTLPEAVPNCVLHYDVYGQRLLYAGPTGNAFAMSLDTGRWSKITSNLGYVNSIAVTPASLLFASGGKVLFVARANNSGLNPPPGMASLGAGMVSGIAVDSTNAAWITDYDKSSIRGPFALN